MAKILQDLWIMTEGGTVIFSRVFDKKINEQLFGALMSALNIVAEECADEGLSNFELSQKRYILLKLNNLFFIGNSDRSIKTKKLTEAIKKIADKFFVIYHSENFKNWGKDISIFNNFEEEINDALQDPVKKFWKGF